MKTMNSNLAPSTLADEIGGHLYLLANLLLMTMKHVSAAERGQVDVTKVDMALGFMTDELQGVLDAWDNLAPRIGCADAQFSKWVAGAPKQ